MGNLPEKQNGEKRPTLGGHSIARRRPTHQRRQCAGDRADGGVEPGDALERSINENISQKRQGPEQARQKIDHQRQVQQPRHRTDSTEDKSGFGLQSA